MTSSAADVAAFLLDLAASEEEPELISHLRLQKLLYYAQGWSLGLRGVPLFDDPIEAWSDGPVVRSVYRTAWTSQNSPVARSAFRGAKPLSRDDQAFVARVWKAYREFSAISLRDMTHAEKPWLDARTGLAPEVKSQNVISIDVMRAHFEGLATANRR